ncbi:PDZ domain-containing protein sprite isoform X2 [Musca autumnalis]|uniref:PDZ domain-containing protein sprite isoform X2 n=1 Tax=Musca autumnalis TaxID=221902 RepID=UPI003CF7DC09
MGNELSLLAIGCRFLDPTMDSGSVVSEPISDAHRAFAKQKSASMTILNPKSTKYSLLQDNTNTKATNNSDTDNLSTCLSHSATTGRRRKGSSLAGTLSSRSTRGECKELRSALQDRETVIQNLRIQLCLGKLPRPSGPPLDESEKPAAEQKLQKLKTEAENKKIKIKNLKGALDKLDITDNIDVRIRQAELEYALGREELQLLSIVEEARALQARLEKSKIQPQSLYNLLSGGVSVGLHAVQATTGRWASQEIPEGSGVFYVEWALEGDGLYKGDRIVEVNGKLVTCKTKEEFQKSIGNTGKCQLVVLRRKPAAIPQKQLDQEKENNLRLQHRISYLEEQVKELQASKYENEHLQLQLQHQQTLQQLQQQNQQQQQENQLHGHVTSISISSPPSTPPDKPLIFQRGSYITTLVGGKPIELLGDETPTPPEIEIKRHNVLTKSKSAAHITKTLIRENSQHDINVMISNKALSSSKISVNSDSNTSHKKDKERQKERYDRNSVSSKSQLHARSVEHLNHMNGYCERRRDTPRGTDIQTLRARLNCDMRSVKSLDFDSDNESNRPRLRAQQSIDTMSEARTVRPTPPKKPLRLSLQRAQSLQTVELNANNEMERKRPVKRAHINEKSSLLCDNHIGSNGSSLLIENCRHAVASATPMHTSSLGRHRHNL